MEKKEFEFPVIEVTHFEEADVLTLSEELSANFPSFEW